MDSESESVIIKIEVEDEGVQYDNYVIDENDIKTEIHTENNEEDQHIVNKEFITHIVEESVSIPNLRPIYECSVCQQQLVSTQELISHQKTHPEKPYQCGICQKLFKHSFSLDLHLLKGICCFKTCEVCQTIFRSKIAFNKHILKHAGLNDLKTIDPLELPDTTKTDSTPFTCYLCDKVISGRTELVSHLEAHGSKIYLANNRCSYKTKLKGKQDSSLKAKHLIKYQSDDWTNMSITNTENHKEKHSKSKVQCQICFKTLSSETTLQQHLKTHSSDKMFICDICGDTFTFKCRLIKHMQNHLSERKNNYKYECDVCHKLFSYKYSIISHLRIHTGEMPYECALCSQKFRLYLTFKNHIEEHRSKGQKVEDQYLRKRQKQKNKNHNCDICGKKFASSYTLRKHNKEIHFGKKHQCEICFKQFHRFNNLKCHTTLHDKSPKHQCHLCKKKFIKEKHLTWHMVKHKSRNETNVSFQQANFKCDICRRGFSKESLFNCHMMMHGKNNTIKNKIEILFNNEDMHKKDSEKDSNHSESSEKVIKCIEFDQSGYKSEALDMNKKSENKKDSNQSESSKKLNEYIGFDQSGYKQNDLKLYNNEALDMNITNENLKDSNQTKLSKKVIEFIEFDKSGHKQNDIKLYQCAICHKNIISVFNFMKHMGGHT